MYCIFKNSVYLCYVDKAQNKKQIFTMTNLPVHASKNSEMVVRFTTLENEVSSSYFKKIKKAYESGRLHGLYLTKTGKIRATIY